ncbi:MULTISPECIES: InlB B-repeat-containing protein [Bifidobacterium]|uniref:Chromosome condensation regulator RCC1 n=1 Tax=Bifidobacterium apousia TaxID=2750996 RepID=A0A556R1I8_9BIFI|nr:InlB B-repeat-containing protein [Bifidobacterium apousia]MBI0136229.1 InlB B-repeat-containing protein [Bifidobacterium sp. W8120]TSJ82756.1 chromosome condensation regulator RCC1 [Bifidobacterium apousia]
MVFDPADGSKAERVTVPDGALASPPADNPKRDGYRFDGWSEHDAMMDFRTPITRDTALKAKWAPAADWALSPDHGPASGGTSITITPPNADSPSFSALEAHDDKLIGVTGDGRLFTWTSKAEMPVQVPSPQGERSDVRFMTGIVGHDGFAALSRDHRIYTWSKGGDTPALLDADSTTYTSIAMAADHLVAVNQDGRIRTWTSKGELTGKAISLPKQATAITVAGNADRLLAMDSKGKIWAWKPDAVDTAQIQDVKIAHRIVQISATDHGFVLLDSAGQTSYLDNRQTQPELLIMPDHSAVAAISSNATQASLVDSNGLVWAWKPGEAPKRADDGSQQYVRAAAAGGRIAAISRQGSMLTWSLDGQGQPGKPVRLDTTAAPILASASLDGQPLSLTAKNSAWRAEAPARKPGQAAILIKGRQDGQPFARSLAYTVDQPPAWAAEPGSTFTVRFDTGGGNPKPADQTVPAPYGRAKRPSPDPAREGYLFDGWFTGQVAYDFSKPVTKDLTLTAKWTPESRNSGWSISPDKGSQLGREPATITPPDSASRGIRFSQVSASTNGSFSLAVGSDGNAYAWGANGYGQLGNGMSSYSGQSTPVMVRKPDRKTYPDLPADFTYLQASAGYVHSLALGSDGNVYAWGYNDYGQLGNGTTGSYQTTPVMVRTPDRKTYPDLPADFTYLQVSAGYQHSLAVGSDGNVYAWGNNSSGQLGNGTTSYSSQNTPVRVKTPDRKTYPDLPADFTYLQVSSGDYHSLALGSDGNVYAWGSNGYGQLGDGTTSSQNTPVRVKTPDRKTYPDLPADFTYLQVSAGYQHSLALGSDGNAWAWGNNGDGRLGDGTSSSRYTPVRVKTPDRKTYPDLPADFTYLQVSAGSDHSLAVGSDGNAWAWGCNGSGNLGNNTTGSSYVPVRVRDPASPKDTSKGLQAAQVSAGSHLSLAVGSDGNAWAWGNNGYGRLGDGSTDSKSVPVPVSFNLALVITGVRFDQAPASGLTRGDAGSVSVTTPAHQPGTVTVSVDYTLGGAPQTPDTSLRYTYLPAGVLPKAGGEGILLALATGMTGMGGVLASRRHRKETRQLVHASHE